MQYNIIYYSVFNFARRFINFSIENHIYIGRGLLIFISILGELSQYRSSFASRCTLAKCSNIFRDRGQTFAPLGILHGSQPHYTVASKDEYVCHTHCLVSCLDSETERDCMTIRKCTNKLT